MNNSRETENHANSSWECIDPAVGSCLWELEVGETTRQRSEQLQAHLELCDACQLDVALKNRLEKDLEEGALILPPVSGARWWQQSAAQASVGSALIAACLALLIILPPAPSGDFVHLRGTADDPHFIRPVEGEVVVPAGAVVSWLPVDGATSYQVTLTDVAGDFKWVGSTRNTQIELPDIAQDQQTMRAVLTTIPADLVSPGRVSVSFSTGSRIQLAQYRISKAPVWMNFLWVSGLVLLGTSLVSRRRSETANCKV